MEKLVALGIVVLAGLAASSILTGNHSLMDLFFQVFGG